MIRRLALPLLACTLASCGGDRAPEDDGDGADDGAVPRPVRVVASVLPHADIVRRVGGSQVRVDVLVPPGAAPSTYEPTVRELRAMAEAELFVRVGHPSFPFERAWLDRLIAERPGVTVIDGSVGAPDLAEDPHVWLSLPAARRCAERVRDVLAERVPAARPALDANLARFLAEVDRIDEALVEVTRGAAGRAFFVFHPAWGYVARAYGIEQIAIEKDGKEPSAAHVAHVVDEMAEAGAEIVFVQPQHASESASVIAAEVGARAVVLDPLPEDWVLGMDALVAALREAFGS